MQPSLMIPHDLTDQHAQIVETKLTIGLDRRAPYTAADRKAQFDAVMKAHGLLNDMTRLAARIDGARDAVRDRLKGLPESDELTRKLRALADKLEAAKKQIAATTEGGAITGEERIREHLDQLYGALDRWEGRPARYKLKRLDVLRRELADVEKAVEVIVTKDARALDDELKSHKLSPLPERVNEFETVVGGILCSVRAASSSSVSWLLGDGCLVMAAW